MNPLIGIFKDGPAGDTIMPLNYTPHVLFFPVRPEPVFKESEHGPHDFDFDRVEYWLEQVTSENVAVYQFVK